MKTETALLLVAGLFLLTQRRNPAPAAPPAPIIIREQADELPTDVGNTGNVVQGVGEVVGGVIDFISGLIPGAPPATQNTQPPVIA